MPRAVVVVFALLAGGHLVGSAQTPVAPSTQPTFKGGTTLVEVSAVVTSNGRPVTDVRADEVTILDNGAPQPVVAFEYVDLGAVQGPAQRRDFVLVIDDLHIHPRRTQPTIDASLALIDALASHDRLAVVRTTLADDALSFSMDREVARAVVRSTRGQGLQSPPAPGELEARTTSALDVVGRVAAGLRADATERRAILLISEGHPAFTPEWSGSMGRERQDVYAAFLDVLRAAALANVAVYTVDPRGLRAPDTASIPSRDMNTSSDAGPMLSSDLAGSLASLAINTGGVQARWSNDLTRMLPQMLQDSRQYYRLAYVQPEPPRGKKQPATRSIKVKVTRPGVEVRARQRYAPAPSQAVVATSQ